MNGAGFSPSLKVPILADGLAQTRIWPTTQALVLHGIGACTSYLSLPVGENAECFDVTKLVKVRVVTASEFSLYHVVNGKTSLVPKPRKGTGFIVRVPKIEIHISAIRLPLYLVFLNRERRCGVQISIETDEIAHGRHGVVHHHVHASLVDLRDGCPPLFDASKMVVLVLPLTFRSVYSVHIKVYQESEVNRRISITRPRKIYEGASSNVKSLKTILKLVAVA